MFSNQSQSLSFWREKFFFFLENGHDSLRGSLYYPTSFCQFCVVLYSMDILAYSI